VTGGGHKKEDEQREESEGLKGEIGDAAVPRVADEQTDERASITKCMKLDQTKPAVREPQKECGYAEVAAVIEQGEKTPVQPGQGPNAQHDV
jgi:hypothetical protein